MASVTYNSSFFSREVAFCKVYRISYFIEWQEKNFWQRLFGTESAKEKNVFTIRINEADIELAKELIQGIDSVKLRKTELHN